MHFFPLGAGVCVSERAAVSMKAISALLPQALAVGAAEGAEEEAGRGERRVLRRLLWGRG